jgi:hypothetical protein
MIRAERRGRSLHPALTTTHLLGEGHVMAAPILAQSKRCSKCKAVKLLDEFYVRSNSRDGRDCSCRSCQSAASRAYNLRHKKTIEQPPAPPYSDDPFSVLFVIFRDIEGFMGYGVDTDGWVWTCIAPQSNRSFFPTWRKLNFGCDRTGHPKVVLMKNGKRHYLYVHHLVLMTFWGPCPPGLQCCHRNGNPRDNRISNLRWGTPASNAEDRERHGRTVKGSRCARSKLSVDQVLSIRELYANGRKPTELGRQFGVSPEAIKFIAKRKVWKHV